MLAPTADDADTPLRHISRIFPSEMARALLPSGPPIDAARWVESQLASRERRLDRALDVQLGPDRRLLHTEWQLVMRANVPLRIFEYHMLSALVFAGETPPHQKPPPIESTVVLLSGREKPWPPEGEYRTSPSDSPFSGVKFKIDAVYQRTVNEIEARGSPLWLIFAPLCVDADPSKMKHVVEKLEREVPPDKFQELVGAMLVMADLDRRRRGLRDAILPLLNKEIVMRSWLYTQGREEGIANGVAVLARLFEHRLGRELSDEERRTLAERLVRLGPDCVGDTFIELTPEALADWLAAPKVGKKRKVRARTQ